MKTSDLSGPLLDAYVWKALDPAYPGQPPRDCPVDWRPSSNWAHGGPIIEREGICVWKDHKAERTQTPLWCAGFELYAESEDYGGRPESWNSLDADFKQRDSSPLTAAMRAYVASKFGDEVETWLHQSKKV